MTLTKQTPRAVVDEASLSELSKAKLNSARIFLYIFGKSEQCVPTVERFDTALELFNDSKVSETDKLFIHGCIEYFCFEIFLLERLPESIKNSKDAKRVFIDLASKVLTDSFHANDLDVPSYFGTAYLSGNSLRKTILARRRIYIDISKATAPSSGVDFEKLIDEAKSWVIHCGGKPIRLLSDLKTIHETGFSFTRAKPCSAAIREYKSQLEKLLKAFKAKDSIVPAPTDEETNSAIMSILHDSSQEEDTVLQGLSDESCPETSGHSSDVISAQPPSLQMHQKVHDNLQQIAKKICATPRPRSSTIEITPQPKKRKRSSSTATPSKRARTVSDDILTVSRENDLPLDRPQSAMDTGEREIEVHPPRPQSSLSRSFETSTSPPTLNQKFLLDLHVCELQAAHAKPVLHKTFEGIRKDTKKILWLASKTGQLLKCVHKLNPPTPRSEIQEILNVLESLHGQFSELDAELKRTDTLMDAVQLKFHGIDASNVYIELSSLMSQYNWFAFFHTNSTAIIREFVALTVALRDFTSKRELTINPPFMFQFAEHFDCFKVFPALIKEVANNIDNIKGSQNMSVSIIKDRFTELMELIERCLHS